MKQNRIKITYGLLLLYSIVLVHFVIFHQYDSEFFDSIHPIKQSVPQGSQSSLRIFRYESHFDVLSDSFEINKNSFEIIKDQKTVSLIIFYFPLILVIAPYYLYLKQIFFSANNFSFIDSHCLKKLQLRAPPSSIIIKP